MTHHDDNDDFLSAMLSLEEPLDSVATRRAKPKTQYPCSECRGTGFYQGHRVHQPKTHCFACRGKGFMLKSPEKRAAQAARRAARKATIKLSVIEQFNTDHPGLLTFLSSSTWSTFALEMAANVTNGKELTEGQIKACYSMMLKSQERDAKRAAEREASKVTVDLQPIRDMFEAAHSAGHKTPVYRAEGLVIKRAPDHGNNPGALYVKSEDDAYFGKILGTEFLPTRDGAAARDALLIIAANPLEAAVAYGRRTGKCACCGRKLTKGESIDRGIGPVCAETWGLL